MRSHACHEDIHHRGKEDAEGDSMLRRVDRRLSYPHVLCGDWFFVIFVMAGRRLRIPADLQTSEIEIDLLPARRRPRGPRAACRFRRATARSRDDREP